MGYYAEVGIGTPKNIEAAKAWYEKVCQTFTRLSIYCCCTEASFFV